MIKVVNHTLLAVEYHDSRVCVLCDSCGHRGVVHKMHFQGHRLTTNGDSTPLSKYTYRCGACGRTKVSLYLTRQQGFDAWRDGKASTPPDDAPEPNMNAARLWPHLSYKDVD